MIGIDYNENTGYFCDDGRGTFTFDFKDYHFKVLNQPNSYDLRRILKFNKEGYTIEGLIEDDVVVYNLADIIKEAGLEDALANSGVSVEDKIAEILEDCDRIIISDGYTKFPLDYKDKCLVAIRNHYAFYLTPEHKVDEHPDFGEVLYAEDIEDSKYLSVYSWNKLFKKFELKEGLVRDKERAYHLKNSIVHYGYPLWKDVIVARRYMEKFED